MSYYEYLEESDVAEFRANPVLAIQKVFREAKIAHKNAPLSVGSPTHTEDFGWVARLKGWLLKHQSYMGIRFPYTWVGPWISGSHGVYGDEIRGDAEGYDVHVLYDTSPESSRQSRKYYDFTDIGPSAGYVGRWEAEAGELFYLACLIKYHRKGRPEKKRK